MVLKNNKVPLLIVNNQFPTSNVPLFGLIVMNNDYNITFIIMQFIKFQSKQVYQVS